MMQSTYCTCVQSTYCTWCSRRIVHGAHVTSTLSLPSRALCSTCKAYVSTHNAMLLPSDSREHRWPIMNTHDQMQTTELAPKLMRVSTTPKTCVHAHALPLLLLISSLFSFCNYFGFPSSWFDICTLVLLFTFSLLIPGPLIPDVRPLSIRSLALLYTACPNSRTHCLTLSSLYLICSYFAVVPLVRISTLIPPAYSAPLEAQQGSAHVKDAQPRPKVLLRL